MNTNFKAIALTLTRNQTRVYSFIGALSSRPSKPLILIVFVENFKSCKYLQFLVEKVTFFLCEFLETQIFKSCNFVSESPT